LTQVLFLLLQISHHGQEGSVVNVQDQPTSTSAQIKTAGRLEVQISNSESYMHRCC
jgi:hypothetical protein